LQNQIIIVSFAP